MVGNCTGFEKGATANDGVLPVPLASTHNLPLEPVHWVSKRFWKLGLPLMTMASWLYTEPFSVSPVRNWMSGHVAGIAPAVAEDGAGAVASRRWRSGRSSRTS